MRGREAGRQAGREGGREGGQKDKQEEQWEGVFCLKQSNFSPQGGGAAVKDVTEVGILDLYLVKHWAIKFATDAAVTVLRVDQVR